MMKRNNLFWGAMLLIIGTLLLLENFGVFAFLNISMWQLIWPVALIALGVWVILAPKYATSTFETQELTLPLQDVQTARVNIDFGAGELLLYGKSETGDLLTGTFDGVEHTLKHSEGQAKLHLKSPIIMMGPFPWTFGPGYKRVWSFGLSDAIPLELSVKTGASDNKLDLSALHVNKLRLESGASATHITLPSNAGYTEVRGSSGAASVELRVPQGVAARIRATNALSSIDVDKQRFPPSGNSYASPDYETAENKVDIKMDIGVGSLHVS